MSTEHWEMATEVEGVGGGGTSLAGQQMRGLVCYTEVPALILMGHFSEF